MFTFIDDEFIKHLKEKCRESKYHEIILMFFNYFRGYETGENVNDRS